MAAGISAQGLTGFARDNMGLTGPWPYLLFFALDGAAGVCAVLLTRRAARAESGLAPRLAVWGLVAASASFNATHAPPAPGRPRGVRADAGHRGRPVRVHAAGTPARAGRADRRLTALRWLHPAERVRVQLLLAADDQISAEAATRRVRVDQAARRLYQLRRACSPAAGAAGPRGLAARRARRAERRAHAALIRAGFADQAVAAEVLRQVQVLTRTPDLARLDYATAEAAQAVIAGLITSGPARSAARPALPRRRHQPRPAPSRTGRPAQPGRRHQRHGSRARTRAGQPGPALAVRGSRGARHSRAGSRREAAASRPDGPGRAADGRRRASSPTPGSTASGSARRRSARSSAATATASPTTACGPAGRGHRSRRRRPHGDRPDARRPVMPPHVAQARKREDDRQAKLDALRTRLHDAAQALRTPGDWAGLPAPGRAAARRGLREHPAHLRPAARRHPGPRLRAVDRGRTAGPPRRERASRSSLPPPGRAATAPRRRRRRARTGLARRHRVAYVWDVSQTTGPPRQRRPPARPAIRRASVGRAVLARPPRGIRRRARARRPGRRHLFWAARRIRVRPQISDEQAVWALAHQLGHVLLHDGPGHPPGTTTTGCTGLRKAEADSVAYITCARYGITPAGACPTPPAGPAPTRAPSPPPPSWPPGSASPPPPPASPATPTASCTATTTPAPATPRRPRHPAAGHGERRHAATHPPPARRQPDHPGQTRDPRHPRRRPGLLHRPARRQLGTRLPARRGISAVRRPDWHIGYAPAGWTTLTDHLRRLGYGDDEIEAAGLAARPPAERSSTTSGTGSCSPSTTPPAGSPGSSAAPTPAPGRRAEVPQQPRDRPSTRKATCCSACTRPARPSPGRGPRHRGRPVRRHRGHHRRPGRTPGSPPAAPP